MAITIDWPFLRNQLGLAPHAGPQLTEAHAKDLADRLRECDWKTPIAREALVTLCLSTRPIDWLLRLTQKRYRDHYKHQWYVTALGCFLLDTHMADGQQQSPLWKYIAARMKAGNQVQRRDVEGAWIIAGALHDHAYPLAHILNSLQSCDQLDEDDRAAAIDGTRKVVEAVGDLYCYELRDLVRRNLAHSERVREFRELVRQYLCEEWDAADERETGPSDDRDCSAFPHGLCAALNLAILMRNKGFRPGVTGTPVGRACVREALRAMILHDTPTRAPVELGSAPLAFLLVLCDELQDWDRLVVAEGRAIPQDSELRLGLEQGGQAPAGKWWLPLDLEVLYHFPDRDTLSESDWDLRVFCDDKQKAFRRLHTPNHTGIANLRFGVSVHGPIPLGRK